MMSHPSSRLGIALLAIGLATLGLTPGCGGPEAIPGAHVAFDVEGGFWSSPFPGAHRRRADGRIRLSGFPNPGRIELVLDLRRLIERDADGFGTTSTLYFRTDSTLDPSSLPGLLDSVDDDASVFLVDVDPDSAERGRRVPLDVAFLPDPGPFGAPNLLALLPLQGAPMREGTLYAAVVTREVRDASGARLGVPETTRRLLEGHDIPGLEGAARRAFDTAIAELRALGVDLDGIAGVTAFRTGRPSAELGEYLVAARAAGVELGRFTSAEVFDEFCVLEARARFPVFQAGPLPYAASGGGWARDDAGRPRIVREADSRVVLTLPRAAPPPAGFPVALFVRTGGGGDRPLVDRGVRATPGGPAIRPGAGPALELARAGFAGLSWDGPHGGIRNPTRGDEQFLVFNFGNPEALRDNIRQSALEASLLVDRLGALTASSTACGPAHLDVETLALMGHSMGATIAPLAAAADPRFDALVLSGAGGSMIANVIHKQSPIPTRPLAEILLDYDDAGRRLIAHDPALALLQWAAEPADTPVYARAWRARPEGPPRVLMMQGVVDTYILPPIANALSLAAGLDLAGPSLEPSLPALLTLSGGRRLDLPARSDGVVTQHPEGPVEDGHEVVFQTPGPKRQYRCFLGDLARGEPSVVVGGGDAGEETCR